MVYALKNKDCYMVDCWYIVTSAVSRENKVYIRVIPLETKKRHPGAL